MKTTTRLLMAAAFGIVLPAAASAQTTPAPATPTPAASTTASNKMTVGKWTGVIVPPQAGDQPLDMEVNVAADADSVKATFDIPAAGISEPLTGIKVEDKKISWAMSVQGMDIKCTLDKQDDGSFKGNCSDASGTNAPLTLSPPKKGFQF
jgi:hypothetical protein